MVGKGLTIVLAATLLVSCHSRRIMTEEEYEEENKAKIDLYFDWCALEKKPTGLTLYFYPTGDEIVDNKVICKHSNDVDHIYVSLPEQDYSVICFNQSESEFSRLEFDFDSFENAAVLVKSEDQVQTGGNVTTLLSPQDLAVGTIESVKSTGTRGFNHNSTLHPKPPIKNLEVDAYVYGLTRNTKVSAKLTNLSIGQNLATNNTLTKTYDQTLPEDVWSVNVPDVDTIAGLISASFGTFGLVTDSSMTRAFDLNDLRNILQLAFFQNGMELTRFDIDVTDQLRAQLERILSGEVADFHIILGKSQDEISDDSDSYITDDGTIVLSTKVSGTTVGVNDWQDTVFVFPLH